MAKASTKAPEQTGAEPKYLRQLIEKKKPVEVKLENGELISGVIEYYDQAFLRVTRENEPNVFIYKDDIKYFYETGADQEETEPLDDTDEPEEDE